VGGLKKLTKLKEGPLLVMTATTVLKEKWVGEKAPGQGLLFSGFEPCAGSSSEGGGKKPEQGEAEIN